MFALARPLPAPGERGLSRCRPLLALPVGRCGAAESWKCLGATGTRPVASAEHRASGTTGPGCTLHGQVGRGTVCPLRGCHRPGKGLGGGDALRAALEVQEAARGSRAAGLLGTQASPRGQGQQTAASPGCPGTTPCACESPGARGSPPSTGRPSVRLARHEGGVFPDPGLRECSPSSGGVRGIRGPGSQSSDRLGHPTFCHEPCGWCVWRECQAPASAGCGGGAVQVAAAPLRLWLGNDLGFCHRKLGVPRAGRRGCPPAGQRPRRLVVGCHEACPAGAPGLGPPPR